MTSRSSLTEHVHDGGLVENLPKVGQFEEAISQYRRTIDMFPDDLAARNGLALTLRKTGRLEEAIALFQQTIDMFPHDLVARNGLADTLRETGRLEEAIALFRHAIDMVPKDPVARNGLALTLRETGRFEEAIALFRQTIDMFPKDLVARNGLADTLREAGRFEEAIAQAPTQSEDRVQVGDHLEAKVTRKHSTAPFYSDHPARRDVLHRKAVAETIATMIEKVWKEDSKEENIDRTFMVHLHGRWGSGKTSILNFLKDALLSHDSDLKNASRSRDKKLNPRWVIVDYNAWRNQNLGPAWWTLMEAVYQQARDQSGGGLRPGGIYLILRDQWWRIRSSYAPYALAAVLVVILGLSLIWIWRATLHLHDEDWLVNGLKIIGSVIGVIVAVFAFGYDYRIGSPRTAKSYLELSRDPLSPLMKRYGELITDIGRPVAVFVDDLDRCDAAFVVELLQTVQTLFRHAKVLYVVAADRDWVCASYQQKYESFSDTLGEPSKSLGHLFLEKVFQLSVEVPHLGDAERDTYWDGLINSRLSATVQDTRDISDKIAAEFEAANTESEVLEIVNRYRGDPIRADIAASKGFQRMHSESLVREREHFLAGYKNLIEPNPRAMKRLLNAYGFRRGFDIQSRRGINQFINN